MISTFGIIAELFGAADGDSLFARRTTMNKSGTRSPHTGGD
jgi:hypothetical protein